MDDRQRTGAGAGSLQPVTSRFGGNALADTVLYSDRSCRCTAIVDAMAQHGLVTDQRANGIVMAFDAVAASSFCAKQGRRCQKSCLKGLTTRLFHFVIRLDKWRVGVESHVYTTALIDQSDYPLQCFSHLYHSYRGYRSDAQCLKHTIHVEDVHSQTERGVKI